MNAGKRLIALEKQALVEVLNSLTCSHLPKCDGMKVYPIPGGFILASQNKLRMYSLESGTPRLLVELPVKSIPSGLLCSVSNPIVTYYCRLCQSYEVSRAE